MSKKIFKSIVSIIAGFFTVAILSILTDTILESLGIFPPAINPRATLPWMLVVALIYRSVYTIVGGYVTARLSPEKGMRDVIILMILGGLGGLAGLIGGWKYGNQWYPILIAVTGPLFVWVGGKLYKKK